MVVGRIGALAGLAGFGGVAQLGEHLLCKQGVVGSIPSTSMVRFGLAGYGASAVPAGSARCLCVRAALDLSWFGFGFGAAWLRYCRWAGRGAGVPGVLVFVTCESGSGALLGAQDNSVASPARGGSADLPHAMGGGEGSVMHPRGCLTRAGGGSAKDHDRPSVDGLQGSGACKCVCVCC